LVSSVRVGVMQLLHSCPVPNVDFASLSLLMDRSLDNTTCSNSYESESESSYSYYDESFIELSVVSSPMAITPPSVANQALQELHDTLADQSYIKRKADQVNLNVNVNVNANVNDDYKEDEDGTTGTVSNFAWCVVDEDMAYLDNSVPQSFRPTRCRNGLLLQYITIHDERLVQLCANIFEPQSISQSNTNNKNNPPPNASLVICVGITGMPYSYGMSSLIHSLPRRLLELVHMLSRLKQPTTATMTNTTTYVNNNNNKNTMDVQQAHKRRQELETILTSLLMDDECLKTNAAVKLEQGITNSTTFDNHTNHDETTNANNGNHPNGLSIIQQQQQRRNKSNNFFASGMSVVKMPKKMSFATDKRRNKKKHKHNQHKDNKHNSNVPTALISSSLPSADLATIISSMHQILSLAEKDMILRPYQIRTKRIASYNNNNSYYSFRKAKGIDQQQQQQQQQLQQQYKSPSRITRKTGIGSSKLDAGLAGSHLPGFDYLSPPQHYTNTNTDYGSIASGVSTIHHSSSLASNATSSTALTSIDSLSSSIPTLLGPVRDSSASKIKYRRNVVAAASAANLFPKSMPLTIGKSPRVAAIVAAATTTTATTTAVPRQGSLQTSSTTTDDTEKSNFDPFSLLANNNNNNNNNGEGIALWDAGGSTTTEEKSNSDTRSSTTKSLASTENYGDHNRMAKPSSVGDHSASTASGTQDSNTQIAVRSIYEPTTKHRAINSLTMNGTNNNNTHDGMKLVINIAMNEDLACSYRNSKMVSCLIDGMIQAQIKSDSSSPTAYNAPFALTLTDASCHIRTVLENNRYADDISNELMAPTDTNDETNNVRYKYAVTLPEINHYFPIVKYKCSDDLLPVPIRIESKVRVTNNHCRVALQIMSNPSNEGDLTEITILMAVPTAVHGGTLSTQPPGGVWNKEKGSVIWCVTELGPGQKFQLQAQFDLVDQLVDGVDELPQFPVLIRCQSMYTQLSNIVVDVCEFGNTTDVSMKLARRFRLSHREKQS